MFLGGKTPLYVRQSWAHVRELWPILAVAHHSDKPTIIALLGTIANNVVSEAESFHIESTVGGRLRRHLVTQVPDACLEQAARLYAVGVKTETHGRPSEAQMADGLTEETKRNAENKRLYYELVTSLHAISIDKSLCVVPLSMHALADIGGTTTWLKCC